MKHCQSCRLLGTSHFFSRAIIVFRMFSHTATENRRIGIGTASTTTVVAAAALVMMRLHGMLDAATVKSQEGLEVAERQSLETDTHVHVTVIVNILALMRLACPADPATKMTIEDVRAAVVHVHHHQTHLRRTEGEEIVTIADKNHITLRARAVRTTQLKINTMTHAVRVIAMIVEAR